LRKEPDEEYLIDTSCWIECYNDTQTGKKIEKATGDRRRYTATAVIGELRNNIRNDEFFAVKAMVLSKSETIHCDEDISQLAGQLRKDKPGGSRVSWVDYIIVATAKVKQLTVCSTDHHFDHFKTLIKVKIFEK
jgi:predicted nucleic acid-binding protein